MATHWRKRQNHNQLPAKFQLVDYSPLIDKILAVSRGDLSGPKDITTRFRQAFCTKAFGRKSTNIDLTLVLHKFSTVAPDLREEDLRQQCYLFLVELWTFYERRWKKHGSSRSNTFYDYARTNLSRWMGIFVANVLIRMLSEKQIEREQFCEQVIADSLTVDLGWVFQESPEEMFRNISIQDKYLIYLRYSKSYSDQEIGLLVGSGKKQVKQQLDRICKRIQRRSKCH